MVNIKNKNFNKLSQLDRIEYRQRYEDTKVSFDIIDIAYYTLIIGAVMLVGGYDEVAKIMLFVSVYIVVINIIIYILCSIYTSIMHRRLAEEYFSCIVKRRSNK